MIGKYTLEIGAKEFLDGMTSSPETDDGGFSPQSSGVNIISNATTTGVLYSAADITDKTGSLNGYIIASCEDSGSSNSKQRIFVTSTGYVYYVDNTYAITNVQNDGGNVAQRKLNEIREAIDALSSRPVQGGDDGVEAAPVSEEHEQALDEAIGLARLPVIRVPLDLRDWLAFRAEETGKALQAVVRELLDEASMLSSAPAQPVREPMWQPIETAPKDGTLLLLWEEHEDEPFIGFWREPRACWVASTTHYDTDGISG
jgi:hypothetical protein